VAVQVVTFSGSQTVVAAIRFKVLEMINTLMLGLAIMYIWMMAGAFGWGLLACRRGCVGGFRKWMGGTGGGLGVFKVKKRQKLMQRMAGMMLFRQNHEPDDENVCVNLYQVLACFAHVSTGGAAAP